MSANPIKATLENYGHLGTVFRAAQTDPDPRKRVEHLEQADAYMRTAIEGALALSEDNPDISELVAAMEQTADRIRTFYARACAQTGTAPKPHVGDLDWFQNQNGSWSHIDGRTHDASAVFDIRDLQRAKAAREGKPQLESMDPEQHQAMSERNQSSMQWSQIMSAANAINLDFEPDDPSASFDAPTI